MKVCNIAVTSQPIGSIKRLPRSWHRLVSLAEGFEHFQYPVDFIISNFVDEEEQKTDGGCQDQGQLWHFSHDFIFNSIFQLHWHFFQCQMIGLDLCWCLQCRLLHKPKQNSSDSGRRSTTLRHITTRQFERWPQWEIRISESRSDCALLATC